MHAAHYSSLLPKIFRHKTTKVRVLQPKVILLDFHGTISERRWEDKVIFPYVRSAVQSFLKDNWADDTVQKCLLGLRNESFEQRFRHKYDEAPVINDETANEELDQSLSAVQLGDFVLWQIANRKETRETHTIERLVWLDGYKRHKISTPVFGDVLEWIRQWHDRYHCSIFVISSIDSRTMKLIMENTDQGNLDQYISGYVSSSKVGDKIMSDIYRRFYEKHVAAKGLLAKTAAAAAAAEHHSKADEAGAVKKRDSGNQSTLGSSGASSNEDLQRAGQQSGSVSSPRSLVARPIMFLTDSGQEAKAASSVADGSVFECLLVSRPGNKRIRTFYLTHFPYIETFGDIEFVA